MFLTSGPWTKILVGVVWISLAESLHLYKFSSAAPPDAYELHGVLYQ